MADEYTDISNLEQLSVCLRTVSDDLEIEENFLEFYELNNIKSDSIVHAIKDIFLRSNLSLQNCRGQTYDGASNMMVPAIWWGKNLVWLHKFNKNNQKQLLPIVMDTHLA